MSRGKRRKNPALRDSDDQQMVLFQTKFESSDEDEKGEAEMDISSPECDEPVPAKKSKESAESSEKSDSSERKEKKKEKSERSASDKSDSKRSEDRKDRKEEKMER
ncbi:hypothetical protein TELCIR_23913, partial [Teladorsagia circumcincta]